LLVQKFFLCIGITYLSLFLSDLFKSNLLSSICTLVFRLGQNLSNIPKSILSKKQFPLILPLPEHKSLRSYLFSSDPIPFLAQVEYCALHQHIYTLVFLFSSVPSNHSFTSQKQNHFLAQGKTQGSTLQHCTKETLTTGPFENTCEVNEVSPKIEEGGVARLKCLQPSRDTYL
jgi:hypothetical protein